MRDAAATLTLWRPYLHRPAFEAGAANLAHYLALRRQDLGTLQQDLSFWGVSSLGRSESRVLPSLDAVAATLAAIAGEPAPVSWPAPEHFLRGRDDLQSQKRLVFGADAEGPYTRIMVTLPAEAATRPELCDQLIEAGADCARINCAHDGPDTWRRMAANVRAAAKARQRDCRILMDLGGPKLRIEDVFAEGSGFGKGGVRLAVGDRFLLTGDEHAESEHPVAVCSDPEVMMQLTLGASVWVDDGKLGTTVESLGPEGAVLRVTSARDKGEKLRAAKGLNFPDTEIDLPALTAKDVADLDVIVEHADMVGYSFVQHAGDVFRLQEELARRGRSDMPLVLKIETRIAAANLPRLIVAAAGRQPTAVMLARGDLAVELGFKRLAEMQEQILWLCEAAHVPVIWATQVLERLVKKGTPARGETTDAAMSQRAECVMLNKGPHLVEGVRFLDDILHRMDRHQTKKTPRLGPLRSWQAEQRLDGRNA